MRTRQVERAFDEPIQQVVIPVVSVSVLTAIVSLLTNLPVLERGCFFLYVGLAAALAARFGRLAALVATAAAIPQINHLVIPPVGFQVPSLAELAAYAAMVWVTFAVTPHDETCGAPPRGREYDAGTALPFTRRDRNPSGEAASLHGKGVRFWVVEPTGQWAADVVVGEEYARLFLNRVQAKERRPLLGWIVRDMIAAGRYSGIEAGFLSGVTVPPPSLLIAQDNADDHGIDSGVVERDS